MPKAGDAQHRKGSRRSGAPRGRRKSGRGELRRFEPVSDDQVLATVERAERHHRKGQADSDAWFGLARRLCCGGCAVMQNLSARLDDCMDDRVRVARSNPIASLVPTQFL
jgi:hypothetical protein